MKTKNKKSNVNDIVVTMLIELLEAFPELVERIEKQQAIIEDLNARLSRLEVFTGMTAPAPLPVAEPVTFAEVEESMSIHFINGEVDYIEPGALLDNDMDEFPF